VSYSNLTDDDIRVYHVGLTFENAWRCYAGMIETGEATLERIEPLIPVAIARELKNYLASTINGLDGDYE
jgi:hypothetical protein